MRVLPGGGMWMLEPNPEFNPQMNKFKRLGFLPEDVSFSDICQKQDNNFFTQILSNEDHVLHQLLPPVRNIPYSLRPRAHDRELPVANTAMRKNFIIRMLYSNL